MKIQKDSTVTLHFDIRLKDGSVADGTRAVGKPFQFQMGTGVFSEKLEEKLLGLTIGDKPKIMLLPEEAFGEPHPSNIFQVPRSKFNEDEALETGMIYLFTQKDGRELPGIIRNIDQHEVTVDFNHPLSGQVILFDMEICAIA